MLDEMDNRKLLQENKTRCISIRSLFIYLLLFSIFISIFTLMYTRYNMSVKELNEEYDPIKKGFLVNSKWCRIPDMDPFEPSLISFYQIHKWQPCPSKASLAYQDGNVLRVNQSVINRWYKHKFKICKVYSIIRNNIDDNHIEYQKVSVEFRTDVEIPHEYIKVKCYDKNNRAIYTNYHAFIQKKIPAINSKNINSTFHTSKIYSHSGRNNSVMDVLLVGIDSVSRLNFMRQLPETRQYLLQKDAIEMLGYNKVGDNTLVNLVPLLTGKYLEDLPWNETLSKTPFDKYNFLWKTFQKNGFRTMFAEDAPVIATFNCAKYGFKVQPTDHYFRPIALALERDSSVWSIRNKCIRDRTVTDMVLQYTYDFVKVYNDTPHFSLTFISSLTHNDMNKAGYADLEYKRFFDKLFKQKLINNTFVVFFSDHGIRFGSYRSTYLGKLEERLPFMFLIPPPWFKERFPHMWRNLKTNSHRLTTPFDIYETLIDILDIEKVTKRELHEEIESTQRKRISLLRKVPLSRSCEEATILPHWCTCHKSKPVNINGSVVIRGAHYLLEGINNKTSHLRKSCVQLELATIREANIIEAKGEVLKFIKHLNYVINRRVQYGKKVNTITNDYQLTIQTSPGEGLFEGSVRYHSKTKDFRLLGDISRTTKYGDQASCVSSSRKFCFCRSNLILKHI